MTLKAKIDEYKQKSAGKASPEAVAIMHSSTAAVQDSIAARAIPVMGQKLAAFELSDSKGNLVRSADLLQKGPLVVSFFRGMW